MRVKKLQQVVAERPFPDYMEWWSMQSEFLDFMSEGIVSQWLALHQNDGDLSLVNAYVSEYVQTVYDKDSRTSLVDEFVRRDYLQPVGSGEFDALSYAFYRSAFELIAEHINVYDHPVETERRLYTKRVGKVFFDLLQNHLNLSRPASLDREADFDQLKGSIQSVGDFLKAQGYLRDHFDFLFSVDVEYTGKRIKQTESDFLNDLKNNGVAYAVYEMGYPAILPSAVYLYHTIGEAQHHSSRTIEEMFDRVGYEARETDDFDPSEYPSDRVVELWEIRRLLTQ
jgi:hypothetical protein